MRLAVLGVLALLAAPVLAQETEESQSGSGEGAAPATGERPPGFGRRPAEHGPGGDARHRRHHPPGRSRTGPTLKVAIERDDLELRFECGARMPDCLEALDRVLGTLPPIE